MKKLLQNYLFNSAYQLLLILSLIHIYTPEKIDYTFYVRYDNSFKTEELEKVTDAYWPELGSGFSNIDKDVKVLSLAFPKGVELKSIHLYSITAMNKYRLLFLMIALFFVYVIFTKKQWFSRQLD